MEVKDIPEEKEMFKPRETRARTCLVLNGSGYVQEVVKIEEEIAPSPQSPPPEEQALIPGENLFTTYQTRTFSGNNSIVIQWGPCVDTSHDLYRPENKSQELQHKIEQAVEKMKTPNPLTAKRIRRFNNINRRNRKSEEDYLNQLKKADSDEEILRVKSRLHAKRYRLKIRSLIDNSIKEIKEKTEIIQMLKNENDRLKTENEAMKQFIQNGNPDIELKIVSDD